jgi:hypothetical protein
MMDPTHLYGFRSFIALLTSTAEADAVGGKKFCCDRISLGDGWARRVENRFKMISRGVSNVFRISNFDLNKSVILPFKIGNIIQNCLGRDLKLSSTRFNHSCLSDLIVTFTSLPKYKNIIIQFIYVLDNVKTRPIITVIIMMTIARQFSPASSYFLSHFRDHIFYSAPCYQHPQWKLDACKCSLLMTNVSKRAD